MTATISTPNQAVIAAGAAVGATFWPLINHALVDALIVAACSLAGAVVASAIFSAVAVVRGRHRWGRLLIDQLDACLGTLEVPAETTAAPASRA